VRKFYFKALNESLGIKCSHARLSICKCTEYTYYPHQEISYRSSTWEISRTIQFIKSVPQTRETSNSNDSIRKLYLVISPWITASLQDIPFLCNHCVLGLFCSPFLPLTPFHSSSYQSSTSSSSSPSSTPFIIIYLIILYHLHLLHYPK